MNYWFWLMIVSSALAALFGVLGSNHQSAVSGKPLEEKLTNLGKEIKLLRERDNDPAEEEILEVEQKFYDIADSFFREKDTASAKLETQRAIDSESEILKSFEISKHFERMFKYSNDIATAYNVKSPNLNIIVEKTPFPKNIFGKNEHQTLISYNIPENDFLWVAIFNPSREIDFFITIYKISKIEYDMYKRTISSIPIKNGVDVFFQDNKFRIRISNSSRADENYLIKSYSTNTDYPIEKLEEFLKSISKEIIELSFI